MAAEIAAHRVIWERIALGREDVGEPRDRRLPLDREDEVEVVDAAAADHALRWAYVSSAARAEPPRRAFRRRIAFVWS